MSSSSSDEEYSYESESPETTPRTPAVRARQPLYVRATRLLMEPMGVRLYASQWAVRVEMAGEAARQGCTQPTITCNWSLPAEYRRVERPDDRLVPLSIRVISQHATHMPIDLSLRLLNATRPYVVRRRCTVAGLDDEVLQPGLVYTNDVCSLAFCSLNALDFSLDALNELLGDDEPALVPKGYPYAELLRQVVMARQLEAMQPLQRRCATADSLTDRPLETSTAWRYERRSTLDDAARFIADHLAPPAARRLSVTKSRFAAAPASGESWLAALSEHLDASPHFDATLRFVVFFAHIR